MRKITTIDLFAGCGGLTDGFAQSGLYETKACVEWEPAPCTNLEKRLYDKWGCSDASERVIRFDIQRTDELLHGFNDPKYGSSKGLDALVGSKLDLIIGGPPCQAYSIAGRIRDEHGMKNDYRNYLFESYLKVVTHFQPRAFVFENVPGILSAKPGVTPIVDLIHRAFSNAGYEIIPNLKNAVIDFTQYGVPQRRKRVIILGLSRNVYGTQAAGMLRKFYTEVLPAYKTSLRTVRDAIGDLPALKPLNRTAVIGGRKYSHSVSEKAIPNHLPRWHNKRDIDTFRLLTKDIETGACQYTTVDALKRLYTEATGKDSNIHKYSVLRWDEPSNTIPAHLYKDGLRHIHPDSQQARSITVREAARLQTFSDDYVFIGSQMEQFKMIGNAVPPEFARCLSFAVYDLLFSEAKY